MLFGEYGSVFLTPGGLKNDQKVVVEEIRQRWMCCTIFKACLLYFHITIHYSYHEIHTFLNMKHFILYSRVLHVHWTIKKIKHLNVREAVRSVMEIRKHCVFNTSEASGFKFLSAIGSENST